MAGVTESCVHDHSKVWRRGYLVNIYLKDHLPSHAMHALVHVAVKNSCLLQLNKPDGHQALRAYLQSLNAKE